MLQQLIDDLRHASHSTAPEAAVKKRLQAFVADPASASQAVPDYEQDDVILFEDSDISIWFCRFQPGTKVPPHDHRMSATIGVFKGVERNDLFSRDAQGRLRLQTSKNISAGDVLQLESDTIHGVACTSTEPSCAIHVYLGQLSTIERALYHPETGEEMAFTDAHYEQLTKDV